MFVSLLVKILISVAFSKVFTYCAPIGLKGFQDFQPKGVNHNSLHGPSKAFKPKTYDDYYYIDTYSVAYYDDDRNRDRHEFAYEDSSANSGIEHTNKIKINSTFNSNSSNVSIAANNDKLGTIDLYDDLYNDYYADSKVDYYRDYYDYFYPSMADTDYYGDLNYYDYYDYI